MSACKWIGYQYKCDPDKAYEVFNQLNSTVGLSKVTLVDASRSEDAPLHDDFEWNDAIAGEKYRRYQAGKIIRSLVITIESPKLKMVKAFCTIENPTLKAARYEPISDIMQNDTKCDRMIDIAKRELIVFRRKYEQLVELKDIFSQIDLFLENCEKQFEKVEIKRLPSSEKSGTEARDER